MGSFGDTRFIVADQAVRNSKLAGSGSCCSCYQVSLAFAG
jgi:hypothetical protein